MTGALARARWLLPEKIKLQIYHALFTSYIHYCSLIWATTTKQNLNKIHILQKKAVRHIGNFDYLSSAQTSFQRYNIIKVSQIYNFRIFRSFYFSSSFKNFLVSTASLQARTRFVNTRYNDNWYLPQFRNNYKLQSLQHNLPFILNKYDSMSNFTLNELKLYFVNVE